MADFDILLAEFREVKEILKNIPSAYVAQVPEIINSKELCKRLDLSEPTLIAWRKKKAIPFIRIGSSIRYNWPKVVEALERRNNKS
ncbi:MAG TPA: helix-turn-helix domain-containing protein [Chitinophagaceae bacterium]|nr:helix-turn-helix domain-containing protein [Chitinophagaceae bacterium]